MKKIVFSIIVPVYNTEKYIEECISSILTQTFQNFEVIIIDDGSTDSSLQKCIKFSEKDKRIKIFKQKNAGVSQARNNGIKNANGEYIIFIDSDDYIESNMLEKIYPFLKEDSLISFGYRKKYLNKEINHKNKKFNLKNIKEMEEKIILDINVGGYICNKVFSKKIIKDKNILFDSKIHYSEDLKFTLEYVKNCKEINYISFSPYIYRMRKSSVSFSYINHKNASILDLLSKLIDEYKENNNITLKLKYDYLLNYYKFKKIYPKEKIRTDILNEEKQIIRSNIVSKKEKIKFYTIHKHLLIYLIAKKLKSKIEKTYD